MLQAIQQHFPAGTQCCKPTNGMFLWVTLPGAPDMEEMLKHAVENEQVAFVPGHAFSVNGSQDAAYSMRLNFSYCNPERIESGIARLGRVLSAKI
jgi:DNA-binding transcriptional MocR family regulator